MRTPRDENRITIGLGVLNTDGVTPVSLTADPVTNRLKTNGASGGTDFGRDVAERDENRVPVFMAVSAVDGVTPVPIYLNAAGELLITIS